MINATEYYGCTIPVGDVFRLGDTAYKVVSSEECSKCSFCDDVSCLHAPYCARSARRDQKSVIFIKVGYMKDVVECNNRQDLVPIGAIFKHSGRTYECVLQDPEMCFSCVGCSFFNGERRCDDKPECRDTHRCDGKDVIFKLVK